MSLQKATTKQLLDGLPPAKRALRHIWRILNAEARGKVQTELALSAILHSAMRGLNGKGSP